jgi:hypothetical protein
MNAFRTKPVTSDRLREMLANTILLSQAAPEAKVANA